MLRFWLVIIHRYVGLTIATFLMVAGLTGCLLAFNHELDAALNPSLLRVRPAPGTVMLDPFVLRERMAAQIPNGRIDEIILDRDPDHTVSVWVEDPTRTGFLGDGVGREWYADPYTGQIVGSREWGNLSEGLVNLMPFIYTLHYKLALGQVGLWLMGIIGLLWTIDCFIGMYLTFPARRAATVADDGRSWLARWKPSWLVQGGSLFGTIFTFHRASGLWVWPLLFVFAWSAVALNLNDVYRPVMNVAFTTTDIWSSLPSQKKPRLIPALSWQEAHHRGRQVLAEQAQQRGFSVDRDTSLGYDPASGLYTLTAHSSLDLPTAKWPQTRVWFDGDIGSFVAFDAPSGISTGNTITAWLIALHVAGVGGVTYQIVVSILGLTVATLSVTGVIIWWKKRTLRVKARRVARVTVP